MIGEELNRVLFVDDDEMLRNANLQTLGLAALQATACASAAEALAVLDADFPGVVVTDVRMPGMDGLELFGRLHEMDPDLPVILITGHGDVPMAVAAMQAGAWDFLTKPFSADQLVASVRRALTARRLVIENRSLRAAAERAAEGDALIGETPVMRQLRSTLRQLANTDTDVLIEGESGTGKELVAHTLYRLSARRSRSFVVFDCATSPLSLAQSELFGHHGGVLPGLSQSHAGRIVGADGGTLFLDRLDALPLPLQASLLRTIEEREVIPLGADRPHTVNVRFVAAVSEQPERLVDRGVLRSDLAIRLSAARLYLPPLRDRRDDIPLLFASFLSGAALRHRRPVPQLDAHVLAHLTNHDWPGNVRELALFAERTVLGLDPVQEAEGHLPLPERTQRFEAEAIRAALRANLGDVRSALSELGLPRKTFYDKLTRYGIVPQDFRKTK